MLLGKSDGETFFAKVKRNWRDGKNQEERQLQLKRVYNPLKCQPGDTIDIGSIETETYSVKSILHYKTPNQDPNFVRYSLESMTNPNGLQVLEVMPGADSQGETYSMFRQLDEFELDEDLITIMENEDVLTQTVETDSGEEEEFDFIKDFVTEANVTLISQESMQEFQVTGVNYYKQNSDEEMYLCVEILEEAEWMQFWEGKRLKSIEVSAMGTLT